LSRRHAAELVVRLAVLNAVFWLLSPSWLIPMSNQTRGAWCVVFLS
jgi:hypothetical protein